MQPILNSLPFRSTMASEQAETSAQGLLASGRLQDSSLPSSEVTSSYSHLSTSRFAALIHTLDAASSTSSTSAGKRKRVDVFSAPIPQRIGVAEWAKARAALSIEKKINQVDAKKRTAKITGQELKTTATTASPSTSSSYAPFSKRQLFDRVASYSLSSYNVRTALPTTSSASSRDLHQAIQILARWLEPIGPALHGWNHLPPRSKTTIPSATSTVKTAPLVTEEGGKNKLHCQTCSSTIVPPAEITSLPMLLESVSKLHSSHSDWCPWTRRRCEPSLYSLSSSTEETGAAGSIVWSMTKTKAKKSMIQQLRQLEEVLRQVNPTLNVTRPAELDESIFSELQNVVETTSPQALLLTLFGWQIPSSPNLSSSTSPRPSILQCSSCSRKISLATTRPIDPKLEHRSFCPWTHGEVQSGMYLPEMMFTSKPTTSFQQGGQSGEDLLIDQVINIAKSKPESEAVPLAGWQLNIRALQGSIAPAPTPSALPLDTSASAQIDLDEGREHADQDLGIKRRKTTDIRRQVRSLLYGKEK